ncbi:MAG TPA: TraU family protein [Burkholderiaceae bacterium]|nr:TraU family protein [Burkholderiaceae bacterium]
MNRFARGVAAMSLVGASVTAIAQSEGALTTASIAAQTLAAAPSCARYRITGACFFLKCGFFGCSVKTSMRVQHFTPDLVVSVYHDPSQHPWEWGRLLAQSTSTVAAAMSGAGVMDSAGTRFKVKRAAGASVMFRDADAIGNPVNTLSMLLSGRLPSLDSPSSVPVPTPMELTKFIAQGPAQVMQQWQQVPQSYIDSGQAQGAQQLFDFNSIWAGATANLSRITGALDQLRGAVDLGSRIGTAAGSAGSMAGAVDAVAGAGAVAGASAGPLAFVCPAGATPFALHYQSNLDAFFWRSLLPLEQLYPASWLPGLREVGSGAVQTWGSVYPRQGSIVQQHPVKGSAVLAQRVADIVGQPAQPHIYTRLNLQPDGYVWFGFQGIRENDGNHTRWQRLYPNPSRSCVVFGSNDVITPATYGDGANADDRGAVWNLWRRQECCQRAGSAFLGSVSF